MGSLLFILPNCALYMIFDVAGLCLPESQTSDWDQARYQGEILGKEWGWKIIMFIETSVILLIQFH